jgi:hypothetical protein
MERLVATFNRRHVEVLCKPESLAEQLRARIAHLVTGPIPEDPPVLRVTLAELEPGWIEVRDSTCRCERGSVEHVVHHARKWMTDAFVAAHPDLLWVHAAAAALDDSCILLAGPAGAGKSTLLVKLIDRGWSLVADDAVGLVAERHKALPLAFTPEVRALSRRFEDDSRIFFEQPKALTHVAPDRVASRPTSVGAIVFPEYSADVDEPQFASLTAVSAAQVLATLCLSLAHDKRAALAGVCRLAKDIPCYRLRYRDSLGAAAELTDRWLTRFRRV